MMMVVFLIWYYTRNDVFGEPNTEVDSVSVALCRFDWHWTTDIHTNPVPNPSVLDVTK